MRKVMLKKVFAVFTAAVMAISFAACSTTSEENDTEKYNIGVSQFADHPSLDNCREGFIAGLEEAGLKIDEDFTVDYQSAQADTKLASQIADKFAASKKDIVCAIATSSAQTAYSACLPKGVPVIFNAISDPISANLVNADGSPLDGITGVSDALPVEDQLKLIRAMLPDASKIGILYTTSEKNSVSTLKTYEELAAKYNFEIVSMGVTKQAEIPAAMDILVTKVDCISNMTDNTVVSALSVVLDTAGKKNIPVFGSEEEQVKNGCVACAGLDYFELGKITGSMAARVLKGEDIKSIPYETMKDAKITINKNVATTLGIEIPEQIAQNAQFTE